MGSQERYTLLFALLMSLARSEGIRRNSVDGYAHSGRACLNSCQGDCVTELTLDRMLRVEPCVNVDSVEYFTAQLRTPEPLCAGPCGRFGLDFDWCFVNRTHWDYCSAQWINELVDNPCPSSEWAQCQPYIRAYTPYGNKCLDRCAPGGRFPMSCRIEISTRRQPCALPARRYLHVGEKSITTPEFPESTSTATDFDESDDAAGVLNGKLRQASDAIGKTIEQIQHILDQDQMPRAQKRPVRGGPMTGIR